MPGQTSTYLQNCLDRLQSGETTALVDLIDAACERLRQITRSMLASYPRLQRWENADDVLQNAVLRLYRALQSVVPASPRDFYRLATLQIRRELIDLTRHYFGPEGHGANHATNAPQTNNSSATPLFEKSDDSLRPAGLADWSEFHEQAGALSDDEREVFDLIWYQSLPHSEAADLLNVSTKTIKRRWHSACLKLHAALNGQLPGM